MLVVLIYVLQVGTYAMKLKKDSMKLCIIVLYLSVAATVFIQCDARSSRHSKASHQVQGMVPKTSPINSKNLKHLNHFLINPTMDPPISQPSADSPYSLPPLDDPLWALSPFSLPQNTPPFCVFPPSTPQPPSTIPTPTIYTQPPPSPPLYETPTFPIQNPPPLTFTPSPPGYSPAPPEYSPIIPNPPEYVPSPPSYVPSPPETVPSPPSYVPSPPEVVPSPPSYVPSPPETVPSPPSYEPSPPETMPSPPGYVPSPPETVPSPPSYEPSPPEYGPSPPEYVPSPPLFQPPVIFPPPSVPPSPYSGPTINLWCVAKPSVPDPIILEAMNYACASGADCESIQPSGSCYHPDTVLAHASYAFNSYWQRTKVAGGTCDFGGTGMLITQDPSFDGCHF
ncbi:carbohydrate-binding X8 domain superfamily protein [Tasmannia lanceolata]|uniref:carbohydrate-binding X8 domain superfamily protein n=1 Tax=Tasmannia lanceolata TaxID=3420 RepID=UPI00406320BE